jgi:hypothetical protein
MLVRARFLGMIDNDDIPIYEQTSQAMREMDLDACFIFAPIEC